MNSRDAKHISAFFLRQGEALRLLSASVLTNSFFFLTRQKLFEEERPCACKCQLTSTKKPERKHAPAYAVL